MLFSSEITIPAGTAVNAPVEVDIKLTIGLITQLDVYFPPGNSCLAFVTFSRSRHQIYPTNPDGYIKGDGVKITGNVFHHIKNPPLIVTVKGYSPSAEYDHTVYFNIWMKLPWQLNFLSDEWWNLAAESSVGRAPFT